MRYAETHGYERDSFKPMAWRYRLRHYGGLETEADKLARLLGQFRFGTVREFLETRVCRIRVFDPIIDPISIAV